MNLILRGGPSARPNHAVALGLALTCAVCCSGCASRGALGTDNALTPVADAYSRNWIVAAPTLVGNVLGGAIGAPVYFAIGAFAHCEDQAEFESCNWAARNMGYGVVVPGVVVGAVTGAPFVPLAMLAPERPVEHLMD